MVKKKRMYGTGSLGPSLLSDGSTVGGSSATSQYLHEPCDHRIGSLEQQLEAQAQQIEEEKRAREELQAQVQALVQKMNYQPQNDEDSPHQ